MVIISTSAVEVIIQAVSPEFSGSLGAAAARPRPLSAASAPSAGERSPSPAFFNVSILMFKSPFGRAVVAALQRVAIRFAGADAHGLLERRDENLAVADLAGLGLGDDRVDHRVDHLAMHRDFDLDLGQEIHGIFRAAIDLGVPLLPSVTFDFGHRHALHAELGKGFAHFIELEGFDDRHHELHLPSFHGCLPPAGRRPALMNYQEPCQFLGVCLSGCHKMIFGEKSMPG